MRSDFFQPSDKEMFSHSATSLTTDALASSEQNGVLTNGDSKFYKGSTREGGLGFERGDLGR